MPVDRMAGAEMAGAALFGQQHLLVPLARGGLLLRG
jgi:hypothetical protein